MFEIRSNRAHSARAPLLIITHYTLKRVRVLVRVLWFGFGPPVRAPWRTATLLADAVAVAGRLRAVVESQTTVRRRRSHIIIASTRHVSGNASALLRLRISGRSAVAHFSNRAHNAQTRAITVQLYFPFCVETQAHTRNSKGATHIEYGTRNRTRNKSGGGGGRPTIPGRSAICSPVTPNSHLPRPPERRAIVNP